MAVMEVSARQLALRSLCQPQNHWQFALAEFRADFASPTDFVSIDFVGVDNGDVKAEIYDLNGLCWQVSSPVLEAKETTPQQVSPAQYPTLRVHFGGRSSGRRRVARQPLRSRSLIKAPSQQPSHSTLPASA